MADPSALLRGASAVTYPANASAPREIGFLQRISGLDAGIGEIEARLRSLGGRLSGQGVAVEAGGQVSQPGSLDGVLSEAEARVRAVLALIDELNGAF